MKKTTLFIIFLAIIAGLLGFYYYQKNIYSKEILKLEILGPEKADLLEEIEYIVKFKNNGDTRLEEPELIFEYPEYALPSEGDSLRITKTAEDLGEAIYPGQEQTFFFKARLMGKEGEAKEAKVSLSYRPKSLKAIYTSETSFTTVIEKVPLTLEFDLPSKIESSKELRFKLNYFSNTNFPLSDLRITIDYPSNFEFIESSPAALEKTEWDVGLLNKAEGGRVEILGRVFGEVGEEKVFQAKIGSWQDNEFVLLKEVARGVTIINPALYITQQINGSPEFIASPGDSLHYEIFFKNIGEETLNDLSLLVTLTGPSFDFQTIKAPEGDFETGDNSIIWDWRRVGDLQLLPSQEEGKVDFWIDMEEEWPIETLDDKNPEIKTKVYLSQNREEFINKVNSKLGIAQQGFFQDEVFDNSGPIPPKIGESTTYTITWQLQNFYNEVKDATVKAVLPKNVKLTGEIFPEEQEEKFTFDSASRELVWKVGDLLAAQGILNPAPNLSFQVSFTPDASQKGKTPNLIEEATITGEDQWTKETLSATSSAIDITLPDDDTVSATQGKVQ